MSVSNGKGGGRGDGERRLRHGRLGAFPFFCWCLGGKKKTETGRAKHFACGSSALLCKADDGELRIEHKPAHAVPVASTNPDQNPRAVATNQDPRGPGQRAHG